MKKGGSGTSLDREEFKVFMPIGTRGVHDEGNKILRIFESSGHPVYLVKNGTGNYQFWVENWVIPIYQAFDETKVEDINISYSRYKILYNVDGKIVVHHIGKYLMPDFAQYTTFAALLAVRFAKEEAFTLFYTDQQATTSIETK